MGIHIQSGLGAENLMSVQCNNYFPRTCGNFPESCKNSISKQRSLAYALIVERRPLSIALARDALHEGERREMVVAITRVAHCGADRVRSFARRRCSVVYAGNPSTLLILASDPLRRHVCDQSVVAVIAVVAVVAAIVDATCYDT